MAKTTIKTVADLAGVSIATVSRVVHGNYPVSKELKMRIEKVIEDVGYRPNAVAASIRTRKTLTVGMLVSRFNNPLVMQSVLGVESVLELNGYQLVISSSNNDLEREKKILNSFHERQVDAVLAVSVSKDDSIFEKFFDDGIPVIIVDRSIPSSRIDMVVNNDKEAMYDLTKYVIHKGHRKIAVLRGNEDIVIGSERTEGFMEAMRDSGFEPNPSFLLVGNFLREKAYRETANLLRSKPLNDLPSAIVCCNTLMAEGAMQAIYEYGLKIPDNISLACYGVLSRSPVFRPRLVCMDQCSEEIGVAAGNLVMDRLNGNNAPSKKMIITASFVEGDSVAEYTL